MLLGAHMSIAGGVDKSLIRGASIGCQAIQIFLKNNTQWVGRPYTEEERRIFFRFKRRYKIGIVFAHDCYLVNLASADSEIRRKSLLALEDECIRAEQLGLPFLVIHPGSHLGQGEKLGLRQIAESIRRIIGRTEKSALRILFETTAGQGTSLGYRFEQLAELLELVGDRARTGVCFDTAHVLAAGYDLRSKQAYAATFRQFDETIGLKNLYVFHLNDSQRPCGSRVDRHEHIGRGFIGLAAFRRLLNDSRFRRLPMVLETPKGPDLKEDIQNLRVLRSLIKKTKSS
jgi:deoxyribonuclease-4